MKPFSIWLKQSVQLLPAGFPGMNRDINLSAS